MAQLGCLKGPWQLDCPKKPEFRSVEALVPLQDARLRIQSVLGTGQGLFSEPCLVMINFQGKQSCMREANGLDCAGRWREMLLVEAALAQVSMRENNEMWTPFIILFFQLWQTCPRAAQGA